MTSGLLGLGYTGLTCATAGGTWDGTSGTCAFATAPTPPTIAVPVGYDPNTGTVDPSNTAGQTNPSLPTNTADLCTLEGGAWNGSSCDQSSLCSLPLGTYNESTSQCDYTTLYLAIGGAAVLLLALLGMKR
jgi:hypothetical protein